MFFLALIDSLVPLFFVVDCSAAGSVCLQQHITQHTMSSHAVGGARGFTVRTVYCCDICGLEVSDQEKIVQHLADHHNGAETVDDNVRLDLAVPQQQNDVTSSSTVLTPKDSRRKSGQSDSRVLSKPVDSKPLVCPNCGRIYKYTRCFERHIEREHKTASSLETVDELRCKAVDASQLASDSLNSTNCEPRQDASRDTSADNLLNNSDQLELQEVTGLLNEVLTSVSDNEQPLEQALKSQMTPYCCAECPKRFRTLRSFQLHTTDKHTGWTYACKWCGRLFVEGSWLHSHMIIDHGEVLDDDRNTDFVEGVLCAHRCTVCRFHYRSAEVLAKHMACHDDPLPPFACSMCTGRYFTKSGLRCHTRRVHSGDNPYACELCGDRFSTAAERTAHLKQHDPDLCTVCGVRLRRRTCSGTDVGDTMCNVCYLEQLSSRDGVQVAREATTMKTSTQHRGGASALPLKYCCDTCGIKFAWRSNLRRHERKHTAQNLLPGSVANKAQHFQCSYCGRVFKQAGNLRRHILRHVEPDKFQHPSYSCKLCGQRFLWKKGLVRHLRNAHSPSLARHIPVVTSASDVIECDSAVASSTSMEADAANLESSRVDRGGDLFRSSEKQVRHQIQHDSTSKDELQPEENSRVLEPCPECGSAFFWRSNVLRHMREQHQGKKTSGRSSEEKHLQCNRCLRRFSRLGYLRVHLQAHENAEKSGGVRSESLLCSQCGQTMSSPRLLHVHMLRHAGVRPHQCKLCDKSFFVVAQLNAHVSVVHRGNRLVCDQCGHEANSKSALRLHCRSAHPVPGVQPSFPCAACSRRFWSQAALQRHAVAHDASRLSIRKAMCSVCSLVFRHVYNLTHHIKTTHADVDCNTPFACATCRQQFDSGLAFKTHYRSKHRNR